MSGIKGWLLAVALTFLCPVAAAAVGLALMRAFGGGWTFCVVFGLAAAAGSASGALVRFAGEPRRSKAVLAAALAFAGLVIYGITFVYGTIRFIY